MIALDTGFVFGDRPFLERIAPVAVHGFDAVEFRDEAQEHEIADVRAALRDAGLPLLGLDTRMGDTIGCAGMPGRGGTGPHRPDRAVERQGHAGLPSGSVFEAANGAPDGHA